MNEIVAEAKKGKGKYQPYAQMKEKYTNMVAWVAARMPKFNKIDVAITWVEPNMRRDPDNITAAQKFILDGLVRAGIIKDDSQKYVNSIIHRFKVDKRNPRVEVVLEEAE
jgi:Holliday junction resolvase RusA-like endonuclease